jgi:hypothetical protein
MTAVTHTTAFPQHTLPGFLPTTSARKTEGVGNAGCQAHPQPRVLSSGSMHTSIHSEVAKTSGIPTQWFTAYSVLSPAIGLFCHRRPWSNLHELNASVEASGPHGFAVRVSTVRYRHLHVHRIPPRVRDDREPPLRWDETAVICEVIWVGCEEEYFCGRGWTAPKSVERGIIHDR